MEYLKKILIGLAAISMIAMGTTSCKEDEEKNQSVAKEDFIGTWTATSGKYNLSMEITETDYRFTITEPGNGGTYDKGAYSISDAGKISFTSSSSIIGVIAMGELRDEKLTLTFTSSIIIVMLGTEAASSTVFAKDDGTGEYAVSGSLEYSEVATWSSVSASFNDGGSYAASASIANSRFNLAIPAPPANSLEPVSEYISLSGITVSAPSAQCAIASFFARKGTQSAEINHVGLSGSSIVSLVMYIYADRNVNVTGTHTYSGGGKDVYNLQLKKGWNTVINTWDYSTSENDFYATGPVPSNSAWITKSDISSSSPARAAATGTYAGGKKQNIFRKFEIKKIATE